MTRRRDMCDVLEDTKVKVLVWHKPKQNEVNKMRQTISEGVLRARQQKEISEQVQTIKAWDTLSEIEKEIALVTTLRGV